MPPPESPPSPLKVNVSFNDSFNCNRSLYYLCPWDGSNSSAGLDDAVREDPNFWYLILLVFPVLTLFGNLLVVLSVAREKSLQNATNYFIVSLAVADISLAVLVMPIAIWVITNHGYWGYSDIFCDVFLMLDVTFCTSSILNLVAISLDRFVAVTSPISYSKHSNFTRVYLTIILTWVLSFGIALPVACGLNYTKYRREASCEFTNSDYMLYSNLGSFYIPAVVMLILYYKIFRVIKQRAHRAAQHRQGQTYTNCNTKITDTAGTMLTKTSAEKPLINQNRSVTTSFIVAANGKKPANGDQLSDDTLFNVQTSSSASAATHPSSIEANCVVMNPCCEDEPMTCEGGRDAPLDPKMIFLPTEPQFANMEEFRRHLKERIKRAKRGSKYRPPSSHRRARGCTPCRCSCGCGPRPPVGCCCLPMGGCAAGFTRLRLRLHIRSNKAKVKEKSAARQEKKATKTLAIVLGVFLFCWVPFFFGSFMTGICLKVPSIENGKFCSNIGKAMTTFTWFGYINSFLNPIIYTIFNIEFRRAFKILLHIK